MSDSDFQRDPRAYALDLLDQGFSATVLLEAALNHMSHDDVRSMLDANELSPRFLGPDEEEEDDSCDRCGAESWLSCICTDQEDI